MSAKSATLIARSPLSDGHSDKWPQHLQGHGGGVVRKTGMLQHGYNQPEQWQEVVGLARLTANKAA